MPNVEYTLRGYNLLVGNPLSSGHEADPGFDNVIFEATYSGATTADLRWRSGGTNQGSGLKAQAKYFGSHDVRAKLSPDV